MTILQQEITLNASVSQVFRAMTSADDFAKVTGQAAEIEESIGGAFSTFGGQIQGHKLDSVSGQRLVQAWRVAAWEEGVFSIVRFDFRSEDGSTRIHLTQQAFPHEFQPHLEAGWHKMYWEPLKRYFA